VAGSCLHSSRNGRHLRIESLTSIQIVVLAVLRGIGYTAGGLVAERLPSRRHLVCDEPLPRNRRLPAA